jgi:hypothetical protein
MIQFNPKQSHGKVSEFELLQGISCLLKPEMAGVHSELSTNHITNTCPLILFVWGK